MARISEKDKARGRLWQFIQSECERTGADPIDVWHETVSQDGAEDTTAWYVVTYVRMALGGMLVLR